MLVKEILEKEQLSQDLQDKMQDVKNLSKYRLFLVCVVKRIILSLDFKPRINTYSKQPRRKLKVNLIVPTLIVERKNAHEKEKSTGR